MNAATTKVRNIVSTNTSDVLLTAFYGTVAVVALVGQVDGAVASLGFPLAAAIPAVAVLELGGIAISAYGDTRRRLGEQAYFARALSAGVAAFAVGFNWIAHADHMRGGFFAGMSLLGYLVWLLHSGARRRDQLRATGNLATVAPVYGVWQWIRHYNVTRRAKALALADPTLGLHGSLQAVAGQDRAAQRSAAIAAVLRDEVTERLGGKKARLALATYDMGAIADRLAATADYDGLAVLLGADLVPARLAGGIKHTCKSKGSGGKYAAGCPRCDELKATPNARKSRTPRQRTRNVAPIGTPTQMKQRYAMASAPVSGPPADDE